MKFLYSDTQDYVDPEYNFLTDSSSPSRERYWDDRYAHEMLSPPPYDGLLIAMSAIRQAKGVANSKVRYSTAEEQRLLRDGARKFLRLNGKKHEDMMLMGDCGAFAYVEHDEPAYKPDEVVDFYLDADVTHGVSPDHVIFDCDVSNPSRKDTSESNRKRFDITLNNAEQFLKLCLNEGKLFEPMGAVQGWSPASMADAAQGLVKMGYKYLAIGGLVPLKVPTIKQILNEVRSRIGMDIKLHLLGFAKADNIGEFKGYNITSFDSTSPLIRAFKDNKSNYYLPGTSGKLEYYTAIRIPQAMDNSRLMQAIKKGLFRAEDVQKKEETALRYLREFDKNERTVDETATAIINYSRLLLDADQSLKADALEKQLSASKQQLLKTLEDKPWRHCGCDICKKAGVEVIVFRGSNRNKRRGFHNLSVYHQHVKRIRES